MKNILIAIAILVISVIAVSTLIGLVNHLYTCYKGWFILILYAFCFLMIYSEVKNHRSKKNNTDNHTNLKEGKTKSNIKYNNGVKKYPPPSPRPIKRG